MATLEDVALTQPIIAMDFSRLSFKHRLKFVWAILFGKYVMNYGPHIMRITIPDSIVPQPRGVEEVYQ